MPLQLPQILLPEEVLRLLQAGQAVRLGLPVLRLQQQRSRVEGVREALKEADEVMQVRMIDFPSAIYHHRDSLPTPWIILLNSLIQK